MTERHPARGRKYPGVGVAALVHDNNSLLMLQRKGAHGEGRWAPPGGWMEFGETPWGAAEREMREEVGLEVAASHYVQAVTNDRHPEGVHSVTLFINAHRLDDLAIPLIGEPDKAAQVAWVPFGQVETLPLFLPMHLFVDSGGFAAWRADG